MANGYWGRILRVNLTAGTTRVDEPDAKFYRRYLGGRGIVVHHLLRDIPQGCDPLSPDNVLVFAASVLTGTGIPGAGRCSAGALSPLTGAYGEGESGGQWGTRLRWAGYDGIVITGKAPTPVYLAVTNDNIQIRPAGHLWGRDTLETQKAVRNELHDDMASVALIGQAGERLVRYACIGLDLHDYMGRSGLGAVMGSKNLKAIAVNGCTQPNVADATALNDIARWLRETYQASLGSMQEMGTARGLAAHNLAGALPTRNFREGRFEGADAISGRHMTDTILVDRESCYACPVHCKRIVEVKDADFVVRREFGGPEYETIGSFGSLLGIGDIRFVAKANEICNAHGLDTISAGMMIAGAIECQERGLLPDRLTRGLDLRFGSAHGALDLLQKIIRRQGLGDILAEGPVRAVAALGPESEPFFLHVKGQPIPLHEPRWKAGLGLGYAVSPTGADHMHNIHDPVFADEDSPAFAAVRSLGILDALDTFDLSPAKARLYVYYVTRRSLDNNLCMCAFMPYSLAQLTDMVHWSAGWDVTDWELMKVSERSIAMTRLFNARRGLTAKDDVLPERFFEPLQSGPLKGRALDRAAFYAARDMVYNMYGWDRTTAAPLPWKLHELDLGWLAE